MCLNSLFFSVGYLIFFIFLIMVLFVWGFVFFLGGKQVFLGVCTKYAKRCYISHGCFDLMVWGLHSLQLLSS